MIMLYRILLIALIITLTAWPVQAEKFYSYVNRNGFIVFSNSRPEGKDIINVEEHEIRREKNRPDLVQYNESRFNQYDDIILKHSRQTGVDYNLIKAVILVESNFNSQARSPKNAKGLMQLIPETANRFGVDNPYDPDQNIRGGTVYLRYLIELFNGNLDLVLSSYNAGENLVKKIMRVPDIRQTRQYISKIIEIYGKTDTSLLDPSIFETPGVKFYKYIDSNGVLTLTNIDPPPGAKPLR